MKKLIFLLAAVLATAASVWYSTGVGRNDPIKILKTARVERGDVSRILEATGIVQLQVGAEVKVGARATGVLESVPVKVGDHVKKGRLIAQIDARELKSRIAQARADLNLAEAKRDYMEKNLPRKRALVAKKLEAQDTLDVAQQDAMVARHAVESARAYVNSLEVQLSYTKIYSPIDGVVSQVAAQEGETIVSGLSVSNLITVIDPTRLEMWIYVDETDIGRVVPGLPVRYTVDAYRDRVFSGTVARIYPQPEVRDNIVYYNALVTVTPEQAQVLRPEMTTQCKIIVETKHDVLTVPNNALKWVKDHQVCFVVDDPAKPPRQVRPTLGLTGLQRSEVVEGLKEGEVVATQLILPGSKAKKDK